VVDHFANHLDICLRSEKQRTIQGKKSYILGMRFVGLPMIVHDCVVDCIWCRSSMFLVNELVVGNGKNVTCIP